MPMAVEIPFGPHVTRHGKVTAAVNMASAGSRLSVQARQLRRAADREDRDDAERQRDGNDDAGVIERKNPCLPPCHGSDQRRCLG